MSNAAGPKLPVRSRSVLVMEDEAVIGLTLVTLLEEWGYRTSGPAPTRAAALEAAERDRPDLVLADIRLARGDDGVDTACELRARFGSPFVLVTGEGDDGADGRLLASNPFACLRKPFEQDELRKVLDDAFPARIEVPGTP